MRTFRLIARHAPRAASPCGGTPPRLPIDVGRRRTLGALWAFPLSLLALPAGAQELEIIPLRHQTPDRVLPVLRPMLEPGGSLSGMNNKLFLRTSPRNREQILRVLAEIDVASRQLIIRVRQDGTDSRSERGYAIGGEAVIGGSGSRVDGRIRDSQQTQRSGGEQQVLATEGSPAFIQVGRSFPIPLRQAITGPNGTVISETTIWRDVGQGFHAVPRLSGERVTLEIGQFADSGTDRHGGGRTQQLSTTVSGRLGEWIEVGGADVGNEGRRDELLGRSSRSESSQRSIWLRVDAVD